jgi:hypothetical protein
MRWVACVVMLLVGCEISANGISFQQPTKPNVRPVDPIPSVVDDQIGEDLRVLIIEDVSQRANLSQVQRAMLTGKSVRKFMTDHATKDGETNFRLLDKTTRLDGNWQGMVDRAIPKPDRWPWLIIENGARLSKPLPETWSELKANLDHFAGVK